MEALVARLSQLDSDAEGALRVVTFFDTLMRRRVGLPALARAASGLAECTAGIRLHTTARAIRMSPDGRAASQPEPTPSTTVAVTLDDEDIGAVWLERSTPARALDDLVLDRLAIAVAAAVERYGPAHTTMADPALVELAISTHTDDPARNRALRLLGFPTGSPICVVAVQPQLSLDRIGRLICPARPVKAAALGDVGVMLAGAVDETRFPTGIRAGVGASVDLARCWTEARTALRFTTSRQPVVKYRDLGALALLAHVPDTAARNNADVAAIVRLADDAEAMDTLDAYCATGSLRRAADLLHLHHSSVARRIDHLGKKLGFGLVEPTGLVRARLALTAWRLLDAH